MGIAGWIILGLAVSGIIFSFVVAWIIYRTLLMRTEPEKWGRAMSMPEDREYAELYAQAEAWREEHGDVRKDAEVTSGKLHLFGEYYDFGRDRAVIILSGRMESCIYGCHYAEPYRKAGYNVLTIDGRAHGLSDGKINSLGYKEYRDVIEWAKMLHDREGNRSVILHGICIGASTAVFTATSPDCPDYVRGIIADGMYQRFLDSFRNHMIADNHPLFPVMWEAMMWIRLVSGADVVFDGPFRRIRKMNRPVLFLHSREDKFSTPDKAQELYDMCPSDKKIVWFEHGGHSRIRAVTPELYDEAIVSYLAEKDF